jgi:hypothetical protein
MSKNSAQQNYEAVKAFAQMVENKRKRENKKPKAKMNPKKYHSALDYNGE